MISSIQPSRIYHEMQQHFNRAPLAKKIAIVALGIFAAAAIAATTYLGMFFTAAALTGATLATIAITRQFAKRSTTDLSALPDFIEKLKNLQPADYNSSPYYNQFYENLAKANPYNLSKAINLVGCELIDGDHGLSKGLSAYAVYRIVTEQSAAKHQKQIENQKWRAIIVPGDGNCMLWSCLALNKKAPVKFDNGEMMQLRGQMADLFKERINNREDATFKTEFVYYLCAQGSEEVKDAVAPDMDIEEPTDAMIENYCNYLRTKGKWNGEFEAQLIATILKKTIFILRQNARGKLEFGTAAGLEYLEERKDNLIVIRHSNGNHYDGLVPVKERL